MSDLEKIAEKVAKANLANIVKKVGAGKTLTKSEFEMVRSVTEPDLFSGQPPSEVIFSLGAVATAEQLYPVTGLKDADLRRIAADINPKTNEPWFPKPVRGKYQTRATLRGLVEFYRSQETKGKLPVFPSMESMSVATGIPKPVLQSAKASGCPGFQYSRCNSAEIIPWLFNNEQTGQVQDWGQRYEKFRALNEEAKYRLTVGQLMAKATAVEVGVAAERIFFAMLDRMPQEFPTALAGRDAVFIKQYLDAFAMEVRTAVETQFQELERLIEKQIETNRQTDELALEDEDNAGRA